MTEKKGTMEDPVVIKDNEEDDDGEANEDLSLKKRDFEDSRETSMSDLCGSGVLSNVVDTKKMNPESAQKILMVEDEPKGEKNDEVERSSSNMVLRKLLRGARYFDPPDDGSMSCYSCGERGHISLNCPTPTKRRKPCFLCGSLKHGAKQCSKGHDCFICQKGGHRAKECPDKYISGSKTAMCLRCGDFGHDMILCKYEYSHDDLKDIQCYVCKSFGHLCCVKPGSNSPPWAVSCYRCGQPGHIGLACGRHFEDSTENDSVNLCYKCGKERHFACECPNSSQVSKRNRETSTPSRRSRKKKKVNSELNFTPLESNGKAKKKDDVNSEHNCTRHESNGKTEKNNRVLSTPYEFSEKTKKNKEKSEHSSAPHVSNGKTKKNNENIQHNSTPLESNRKTTKKSGNLDRPHESIEETKSEHNSTQMKKANEENSEHNSIPHESKKKNKKKRKKKTHNGKQSETTPQKANQRGSCFAEDPVEISFHRETIRRPRSPIAPSSHIHHRLSITPSGHNQSLPATYMCHNHRLPTTSYMGHDRRSPTFNSTEHFLGSQSITPYSRNHRISPFESNGNHLLGHNHRSRTFSSGGDFSVSLPTNLYGRDQRTSSFESNGYPSGPPTSSHYNHHHQPYYPPPSHYYRQPYYPPPPSHYHHQQQQHRYAHLSSRYGPAHHYDYYGEFPGNNERR